MQKQTEPIHKNLHTGIPNINSARRMWERNKNAQPRINCIHLGHPKHSTTRTIPSRTSTLSPLPYDIYKTSRQLPGKKHQKTPRAPPDCGVHGRTNLGARRGRQRAQVKNTKLLDANLTPKQQPS